MNTDALTTLDRLKTFMSISDTSHDTLLTSLIDSVSNFITGYCDRPFQLATYTNEIYDGSGIDTLLLKSYPIVSVTKLEERAGSDNISNWYTIGSYLYFVKSQAGIIQLSSGIFKKLPQLYRLTYSAGYDFDTAGTKTLESVGLGDLEYAVWKLVTNAFNDAKTSSKVQSESIGNYSVTYRRDLGTDPEIKGILDSYRRPPLT